VSHHQVAILGAGPAGLSAARRLSELGVSDIVVVEREAEPGGVPRHCGHRAFGLREFGNLLTGPAYAARLRAAAAGLHLRLRTTVTGLDPGGRVRLLHPENGPHSLEACAVLIAFGVRETPRSTRLVAGDRPWGVLTTGALQQFVYLTKVRPFRRAVVIGSELVSFSALLTLRHARMEAVAMIEEGARVTARRPADWIARLLLRVPVLTSTRLIAIHGLDKVESVEIERSGRREQIDCDGVVFTGGFRPETAVLAAGHIALDPGTGGPSIDQHWRSSDPQVFAAGNLLHPVETAGIAWAEGRAAAEAIADELAGRLPAHRPSVALTAKPPLRYVYPQRLALPLKRLSGLMLKARAERAARGRLRIMAEGRELWGRRMRILPERRIELPPDCLPRQVDKPLIVDFVEDKSPG
jgi:NADPH-dependent 2,4-dienoyl-CoA reductase/sulfur reductase-like enzyme